MKVFNLTSHPLDFHGRIIAPNGGHLEYPELNTFVPTRDMKLEEQRIIAFGALPAWWVKEHQEMPKPAHKRVTAKVVDVVAVSDEVKTVSKDEKYSQKKTYR
jgi:hypothetical protein